MTSAEDIARKQNRGSAAAAPYYAALAAWNAQMMRKVTELMVERGLIPAPPVDPPTSPSEAGS